MNKIPSHPLRHHTRAAREIRCPSGLPVIGGRRRGRRGPVPGTPLAPPGSRRTLIAEPSLEPLCGRQDLPLNSTQVQAGQGSHDPLVDGTLRGRLIRVPPLLEPERDVDEPDQDRHLDERADHGGERDLRADAEDRNSDGDGEFEVVRRCCEGQGRRTRVVDVEPVAHPERDEEHH